MSVVPASRALPLTTPFLRASRVVERNALVYTHTWLILVSGFAEPFLYLLGIGYGVGSLVGSVDVGGGHSLPYATFVAPALMASSAMNGTIYEMTFNFFHKLRYSKTFETMMSTPLQIGEIVMGEIGWALIRGTLYAGAFAIIMEALGLATSWWTLLAVPAAILIGLAFACVGTYATTYVRTWADFDLIQIVLMPMFLFSATFYPLSRYPGGLQVVVELTPLYHGVHMLRSLTTGGVDATLLADVAYLLALAVVSFALARRRLVRKLLV